MLKSCNSKSKPNPNLNFQSRLIRYIEVILPNGTLLSNKSGSFTGVARGLLPRAEEKSLGPNLQGKGVGAPPGRECTSQGRARVHF